jgi:hypothetical protein
MILRRLTANLRAQNWTAISIEFLIVVVGVFIGTQVSNWNEARLEKVRTERMLEQFVPELGNQISFYNTNMHYYATTRRYAEQAFAGWRRDPKISDEQFVIAAYQASQITGIGLNADAWSLTFGGNQIRDIDDSGLRRLLEVVLTADYGPVDYTTVATPYREQVRHLIANDVQDDIRRACGDRTTMRNDGFQVLVLPETCSLRLDAKKAAASAAALRAHPELAQELTWHLAAVAAYLQNFEGLIIPMQTLKDQLEKRT